MGIGPSFGEKLRQLREDAGLTQEELAERAGLSVQAVGALERGDRTRPYPQTVRSLATALELDDAAHAALMVTLPRRGEGDGSNATATGSRSAAGGGSVHETIAFAPAARLPATPTTLIGREAELAAARDLIEPGGAR